MVHRKFQARLDPGQKQSFDRSLGQIYLQVTESLLEMWCRQQAAHPENRDAGGSHTMELSRAGAFVGSALLLISTWTWLRPPACWQVYSQNNPLGRDVAPPIRL